jgi:hypothetical protein
MWMVHRLDGIPVSRFLLPQTRPLAACVAMVAVIALVRPTLHGLRPGSRLIIEVTLGCVVYLGAALVLFRTASRELLGLIRSALFRR